MKVLLTATVITLLALPGLGGRLANRQSMSRRRFRLPSSSIWIDVYQGEPLRYREMLDDLATADVIYLGEFHTIQRHHEIQAEVLAHLAQSGVSLALGLEQMDPRSNRNWIVTIGAKSTSSNSPTRRNGVNAGTTTGNTGLPWRPPARDGFLLWH